MWIRGDYVVSDATLNRFFAFHVIAIPLVLLGLVVVHSMALHEVGLQQPRRHRDQEEARTPAASRSTASRSIRTTRSRTLVGVVVFLAVFSFIVFFAPEMGGYFLEYNNFIPADPLQDAAAHRAGLVLHALLRDAARRAGLPAHAVLGRGGDGGGGADLLLPAVARPQPGQVDPLQGPYYKIALDAVRDQLPGAGLARHAADRLPGQASARPRWR